MTQFVQGYAGSTCGNQDSIPRLSDSKARATSTPLGCLPINEKIVYFRHLLKINLNQLQCVLPCSETDCLACSCISICPYV